MASRTKRNCGDATLSVADNVVEDEQHFDGEETFTKIENLQKYGINISDIKKIKDVGIHTIEGLQRTSMKILLSIKGFSDAKIAKVKQAAANEVDPLKFQTANAALALRQRTVKMTTGSKELDALLGGGIETESLTEIYGEFRTGKTQLCHTLCVTAQLPRSMGGAEGKVIYLDTEGSFRPERIKEIAVSYGLNADDVLENIVTARVYTSDHQMEILAQVVSTITEDESPYRLLIVDSVMALYRVDYSGRGELADRQQKLGRHLNALKKIASGLKIAVVLTNQVTAEPGGMACFGPIAKPIGGNVLAHAVTTRFQMKKGRGETRICKLVDSPHCPDGDCTILLAAKGVCDAD